MIRQLLLLLFLLLLTGCFGTKPKVEPWFYTPPRDNSATLYGVGDGASFESAKAEALSAISHHISMTLQSSYEKSDQAIRKDGNEKTLQEIRHHIKTQAKSIRFTKVNVVKEQVLEKRVYLLVSVDRAKLYKEHQRQLDKKLKKIDREIKASSALSPLERFIALKHFDDVSVALYATVALLRAIDSRRQLSVYEHKIAAYDAQYLKAKNSLKLHVKSNRESQMFKLVLQKALMNLGVKLVEKGADGIIEVSSHSKKDKIMGYNIEKCFIHVKMSSAKKSGIASQDYVIVGKSKIDFSQSHHNCVTKFESRISDEGIFKSLGM
jgi:hypothetical protein